MRTFFSFLTAAFLGLGAVQAQVAVGFGPRLGGNVSSATFNFVDNASGPGGSFSSSRSSLMGFQVGLGASIGSGHWAVQPAVVFTQKGLKGAAQSTFDFFGSPTTVNESYTARVNFLELPVNVVYALGSNGEGFQLFAGPYLAVGVGGTGDYDLKISTPGQEPETYSGSQGMEFGDRFLEPTPGNGSQLYVEFRARRFDAGLNAGIGYRRGVSDAAGLRPGVAQRPARLPRQLPAVQRHGLPPRHPIHGHVLLPGQWRQVSHGK